MEIEIKLRLASASDHAKLAAVLRPGYRTRHEQENYFFDGSNGELRASRFVLRIRFYNRNKRALLTVKGKQILQDGVGRASEQEVDLDPVKAREYLADPSALLGAGVPLVDELAKRLDLTGLSFLGGFQNVRQEFDWEGLVLELDQTTFDWGTLFELEAETNTPETFKPRLEALLSESDVEFSDSKTSKFANFINKTLL